MLNSQISLPDKSQSWKLPPIRAVVGDDTELKKWRENLYLSMTMKNSNAISGFLSRRVQVVEMMKILNGGRDRTKKSPWATLQAIIRYKKGYANNTEITTGDVRAELENIDHDFSLKNTDRNFPPQRTIGEIIQEIQETTAAAQIVDDNKFLTITIAGFDTPIIGRMRETIITLLQESRDKKEIPISEKPAPDKIEEPIALPIPRATPPLNTSRGLPPRTVDAAALHQIRVAVIKNTRQGGQAPHTNGKIHPEVELKPRGVHNPEIKHHPRPVQRSAAEYVTEHRDFMRNEGVQRTIQDAWEKSCTKGKHDSLIFEKFIRYKDLEALTRLQAIRRLANHKNWESVLQYVFGENSVSPHPLVEKIEKLPADTAQNGFIPPATVIAKPDTKPITRPILLKPILPAKPVIPKSTPLPPVTKVIGEQQSYEVLAFQILENPEWMAFLQPLCGLHTSKHYAQFYSEWSAFQGNEDDDMQTDLWNALQECRAAKNNPKEGVLHIAFELCGKAFTVQDGDLYTKEYNRKKRIPELLKANAGYEDLINDLEGIKTYQDLSVRMKDVIISIPLDADEWLLYQEKISQKSSLNSLVEKELLRKHPGGMRTLERSVYLRTAKKIVRSLGKKGSG